MKQNLRKSPALMCVTCVQITDRFSWGRDGKFCRTHVGFTQLPKFLQRTASTETFTSTVLFVYDIQNNVPSQMTWYMHTYIDACMHTYIQQHDLVYYIKNNSPRETVISLEETAMYQRGRVQVYEYVDGLHLSLIRARVCVCACIVGAMRWKKHTRTVLPKNEKMPVRTRVSVFVHHVLNPSHLH
jgi:hypothetical protein